MMVYAVYNTYYDWDTISIEWDRSKCSSIWTNYRDVAGMMLQYYQLFYRGILPKRQQVAAIFWLN